MRGALEKLRVDERALAPKAAPEAQESVPDDAVWLVPYTIDTSKHIVHQFQVIWPHNGIDCGSKR